MKQLILKVLCNSAVLIGAPLLFAVAVATEHPPVSHQTGPNLKAVEKLIETSSAARKVEQSNNRDASTLRDEARNLYQQAKTAAKKGQLAESEELLKQATKTMYDAVRLSGMDESLADKDIEEFDARLESINALSDAYNRIRKEKGLGAPEKSELYPIVHFKLDQAKKLKNQGKVKEGRKVLDEAYVAAKVAIEHLRGGETLVRSLNFASKEEEYDHELDRNNTHQMLGNVLLKEKMDGSAGIEGMVKKFTGKANSLRAQGEKQAAKGDYEAAIRSLEQSTKEILRAIRSAGIYIPG